MVAEPPAADELLPPTPALGDVEADGLGLADLAGALATVTVAALAVLLTFLPVLASATETVAL